MKLKFWDSSLILYIVIGLLAIVMIYYNWMIGSLALLSLIILFVNKYASDRRRMKKWQSKIEKISSSIDSAARYAVFNLPVPLVMIDAEGEISWENSRFSDIFGGKSHYAVNIEKLAPNLNLDILMLSQEQHGVEINNRVFNVYPNIVNMDGNNIHTAMTVLYLFDVTEWNQLQAKYKAEKPVIAVINIDNLEDVLNDTREDKVPFVLSEIDKRIIQWASEMKGMIKKYQSDKYVCLLESQYFLQAESRKFSILDDVREIDAGNKMPITLSIGIGTSKKSISFMEMEEEAFACLELALGRGGDQAVLKKDNNYEFYGGKTKAVEKRNRVKARVVAHGVRSLIDESSQVFIMGHKRPDFDAFGAAVGVYRAVLMRGIPAFLIMPEHLEGIQAAYDLFVDNEEYHFMKAERALENVDGNTLLVVVDTHKPSLVESPELVEKCDKIVVIDHHRRSTEFIDKAVIKYMEPYASSASELVAEVLQYIDIKPELLTEEADALLAGITVDTKFFTIKTGTRTFEAAAFLRRQGADPVRVRQLFQDDLNTFVEKATIVGNAERYFDKIAISTSNVQSDQIQVIAAQASDELLDIKGIQASFVIARKQDDITFVSGRSLGDINVQVILEKIGGGGHLEVAGAQFEDKEIPVVKQLLIEAIEAYREEMEEA